MMVNCEGPCEDWYHCSCVGIDEVDTKELLDRYVCPNCSSDKNFTTWKPMCRYGNVGRHLGIPECRKAARVTMEPPSKYCSEDHRLQFWLFVKSQVRDDAEPSKGGALNQDEVGWILNQCKTAEEIHILGAKPKLPKKEDTDPSEYISSFSFK
jgi:COMPASS component SPP1